MLKKMTSDGTTTLLELLQRSDGWVWVPLAELPGDLARNVAPESRSLRAYVRPVAEGDIHLYGSSLDEYRPFPKGYAAGERLPAGSYLVEVI